MPSTFISRRSGGVPAGTIVLWYGLKANIPVGWALYSAAVDKLVMGAATANTSPLGNATHNHIYTNRTGLGGSHTHSPVITIGVPINTVRPTFTTAGDENAYWAHEQHTGHSVSVTVSTAPNHSHPMSATGNASNLPVSFGLYYIRKT